MNPPRTPGGPVRPPMPTPIEALQQRVHMKYGAFGERPAEVDEERRIFADDFLRLTLEIMGVVMVVTLLGFFAQAPTFSAPGEWANTPRLDTGLMLFWGPALWYAMARLKLRKSVRIYLVLSLFIEAFSEAMFRQKGDGYWDTVMWPVSVGWFGTLKEFAGIPGASLSMFSLVTVGLLYRAVLGKKPADWVPPPKFARRALQLFFGTVIILAAWGLAHGGKVDWTFRQTVHMLQLPLVSGLFLYALKIPDDLAAIGTAFVATAVARSVLVAWVYFGVCVLEGITAQPGKPEWCTNHSDTVLFVTALLILLAWAVEQRTSKVTYRALGLAAVILFAVVLNNRRLAFVSLGTAALVTYLALEPSRRKRRITAAIAVALPAFVLYVLVGSEIDSASPLVKPAKIVMSILEQKDTSTLSRDIENENLIYTLRESPILTTGFGHEYRYSPNNPPVDLTDLFKNFRLIAHNGVLWLWSLAGVVGFALIWILYPMAGTLAVRGYRGGPTSLERSAALASLGAVVVCVVQIYGDQGFNSYMTLITFGVAFAVAVRVAARTQQEADWGAGS